MTTTHHRLRCTASNTTKQKDGRRELCSIVAVGTGKVIQKDGRRELYSIAAVGTGKVIQ